MLRILVPGFALQFGAALAQPAVAQSGVDLVRESIIAQGGYADLAPGPDCEYRCPVFPTTAEVCNGIDDDCDGKVDEQLVTPKNDICNHRTGTPCANATCNGDSSIPHPSAK